MTAWTGTPRLVRLALRRDRVRLPVWIVAICGLIAAVIAAETSIYQDAAQRAAGAAFSADNIMSRFADGPASGTSLGAMSIVESYLVLAIFVALMSAQAVVRHTRLDEETGRAELIESSVVGRHAPPDRGTHRCSGGQCGHRACRDARPRRIRTPLRWLARGGSLARRRGPGVRERCRGGRSGVGHAAGGERPCGARARGCLPAPRGRRCVRDRRAERGRAHQFVAVMAVTHRLGSADAALPPGQLGHWGAVLRLRRARRRPRLSAVRRQRPWRRTHPRSPRSSLGLSQVGEPLGTGVAPPTGSAPGVDRGNGGHGWHVWRRRNHR